MDAARRAPVRSEKKLGTSDATPGEQARFLSKIFRSDMEFDEGTLRNSLQTYVLIGTSDVQPFSLQELQEAISKMKRRKCADEKGLVSDIFKEASQAFLERLLRSFNDMLRVGRLDPSWASTLFTMIPKSGDRADPANWRPIAILRASYKIFARLLLQRLHPYLEPRQSPDQRGFRPGCCS